MTISQDGSKLLENCIKMIGVFSNPKLYLILNRVVNLPTQRTQNDQRIYFSDVATNRFGNYVIQRAFEQSNVKQKNVIVEKIKQILKTVPNAETTPLKHILKYMQLKHNSYFKEIMNNPNYSQNEHTKIPR